MLERALRLVSRRGQSAMDSLTQRQREILLLIAEGNSTRSIAERLNISIKTVETHRTQIMRRLDIHDVDTLTRVAIRNGLIAQESHEKEDGPPDELAAFERVIPKRSDRGRTSHQRTAERISAVLEHSE